MTMDMLSYDTLLNFRTPWLPDGGDSPHIVLTARISSALHHSQIPVGKEMQALLRKIAKKYHYSFADPEPPRSPSSNVIILPTLLQKKVLFSAMPLKGTPPEKTLLVRENFQEILLLQDDDLIHIRHGLDHSPDITITETNAMLTEHFGIIPDNYKFEAILHLPALKQLKYTTKIPDTAKTLRLSFCPIFVFQNANHGAFYRFITPQETVVSPLEEAKDFLTKLEIFCDAERRARNNLRKNFLPSFYQRVKQRVQFIRSARIYPLQEAQDDLSTILLASELGMLPNTTPEDALKVMEQLLTPIPTPPENISDQRRLKIMRQLLAPRP